MKKEALLKALGKRIRSIRTENGITQADLASAIGKDQQSIQRLEAGNVNPSFYYLVEVAIGLDVTVDRLIKDL